MFQFQEFKVREKKLMIQFKSHQAEGDPPCLCFILFSSSTDSVQPIHIREGNLLHSVCGMKCLSHSKTPS